jgi:hypothetical protein
VKEFVVGVEINDDPVAFPFSVLNDEPVVNYEVGGEPVLVVFNAETGSGVVYEREVDGQPLTFSQVEGTTIVDAETGTEWNGLTGEALGGSLAGITLNRVKSTSSFWFGWKDWYPDSVIYGLDS